MNTKTLTILAVLTGLLVVLAVVLSLDRRAATERTTGEALLPGLEQRLNEVDQVVISGGDSGARATLQRGEAGWGVVERAGYPADVPKLRRTLISMADARLLEQKTADPDHYEQLGVADPQSADSTSTQLEISAGGQQLHTLIIGKSSRRGQPATYVRRPEQPHSWLASGQLEVSSEPQQWLRKDILDIPMQRLRSIELVHPDGDRIVLRKPTSDSSEFELIDIPDGRQAQSPSSRNAIANALSNLQLDDVLPADQFDPGDLEPVRGSFETFDGLQVQTRAWQLDNDRYLALSVQDLPDAAPVTADEPPATDAAAAAMDDGAVEDVAVQAHALQSRVEGWVYRIPAYKFSNLTKRQEDLLQAEEDAAQ